MVVELLEKARRGVMRMHVGRPCRYCKSPAWRNPCWWYLDHPDDRRTGIDTPCACDDSTAEDMARDRRHGIIGWIMVVTMIAGAAALAWLI